ncbi:protein translocase subunit [Didymosphaeria variabile]|uniref:Mitochondrial import inner membrane translocase subunit n=1 Tax=Didymosphaeria variabile TaxID=1932322 RepID=A0A9W8XRC4_9PLEO|nr:protein translocase subunit [Didymosphaeria variabile]KAJ4356491.1 protein translocase subunit [Didymosphaeria variabile]
MDSLGGMGSLGGGDPKTQIMRQVQQEAAMQNARMLVEKLNEHCFDRCVPKPAASLSKGEEGCFTACMEKYMSAWNTVSKTYVARIQKESQTGAALSNSF